MLKMKKLYVFFICFLLILNSCAPSRFVKPLAKNEKVISASFGGPMIVFAGAPIPIPFTTIGYAQGISSNVTLFGNLHSTSSLFGNVQTDIGGTIQLFKKQEVFGISVSPALQAAYNIRNKSGLRFWPSCDLNFYHQLKQKASYFYSGVNCWVELASKKAFGEKQNQHLIPNLQVGFVCLYNKWRHQFQLSYFGIGIANQPGVVGYIGVAGKGALGFHYAVIRTLKWKKD